MLTNETCSFTKDDSFYASMLLRLTVRMADSCVQVQPLGIGFVVVVGQHDLTKWSLSTANKLVAASSIFTLGYLE